MRTVAKYFSEAKRLVVYGNTWTLTARVPTFEHLSVVLRHHGLVHRAEPYQRKWEKVGGIYYAELKRVSHG